MNINNDNFLDELKNRNPLVIDFIIDEYGSLLKHVILKNLYSNKDSWEESFNDVLLAIWNNPERFDDKKSNFKSWICAIAKFKAIDTFRREVKHQGKNISMDDENSIDWLNSLSASENGISLSDNSIEELEKLLRCLSVDDKDLFFRRYIYEQSVDQIAKEKDMKPDLIYKRISRGKKKIKDHVECAQEV